ncbi:unnamed protein product [Soboliphyme baturini]|uniref:E2F_CC-MB domain-containing protein n=1 Tax=Soboliphyme baturini TaxID=241478 RepID=A0A183J3Z1_9BILA|nr:unnamed protein product [Soboliphyme baturini]
MSLFLNLRGGAVGKLGELTPAAAEKLFNLKLELTELEREERALESHIKWLKQSFKNVVEYHDNHHYAYLKDTDIRKAFGDETLLATVANPGMEINVARPFRVRQINVSDKISDGLFQVLF